ncbi:MAG: serine hydrolase domain-containing protein [Dehalococcoidia bacterium]|jgi:CubicO group peptidase (beta-lactamase class C family)
MRTVNVFKRTLWLACSALFISILLVSSLLTACAQPAVFNTETVRPEDVGLSSDALNQIGTTLNADIADGKINGAVLLVARNGKTAYLKSFGTRDADNKVPMTSDSIFRIFSMTKSLTAVSIAMLMEDGKLALTDPVSKYIPAFKNMKVAQITQDKDGNDVVTLVQANREITIKDLATHTSGLGYWFLLPTALQNIYLQAGMADLEGLTNAQVCDKIANLPLAENPGTLYRYGMNYDVLGRVIEVISGMTLDQFFAERIYKPLKMKDSGFQVAARDEDRLVYLDPAWPLSIDPTSPDRKFWSGGGGSVSTAPDYARFAQMLLNGGQLDGVRLLKPETVALITSDQLGPLGDRKDSMYVPGKGYGEGFDFYVRVDDPASNAPGSVGAFTKDGIAGTCYWVDPKENLVAVFMISSTSLGQYYRFSMGPAIYQAITK